METVQQVSELVHLHERALGLDDWPTMLVSASSMEAYDAPRSTVLSLLA